MKAEGHRVGLLDDEPHLSLYEATIIKANAFCQTIADMRDYAEIKGIVDVEDFVELILACRERSIEDAKN
jgi:hypothetical protein